VFVAIQSFDVIYCGIEIIDLSIVLKIFFIEINSFKSILIYILDSHNSCKTCILFINRLNRKIFVFLLNSKKCYSNELKKEQ